MHMPLLIFQPSPLKPTKMLYQTRSFSPFSCIYMENLASLPSQLRAPVHRRSASDSLALTMKLPYLINSGTGDNFSGQGDLEPNHGADYSIDINCDKNLISSGDQGTILVPAEDSSNKIEPQKRGPNYDHDNMDPKKIKRMLANRVSAQRSRLRKLEYIDKLKRAIDNEEARLSMICPQVSYYETRCKLLEIKNHEMKEKMEALENERASKEAEYQALLKERHALGLAYKLPQEGN